MFYVSTTSSCCVVQAGDTKFANVLKIVAKWWEMQTLDLHVFLLNGFSFFNNCFLILCRLNAFYRHRAVTLHQKWKTNFAVSCQLTSFSPPPAPPPQKKKKKKKKEKTLKPKRKHRMILFGIKISVMLQRLSTIE